jgi:hypothetical protein
MLEDAPESHPRYQLSAEDLIAFGFKEYRPNREWDKCDRCFQYRRTDERGIRFFVQVEFWEHSKYSNAERECPDGWSADAQFNARSDLPTFNVDLLSVAHMRPQEIVDWFESVWLRLSCAYYDEFDLLGDA